MTDADRRGSLGRSVLLLLVLAGAACAQTQTIPLGDVVKQPRPSRRAARVITNDDIPSRPEPAPEPSAAVSDDEENSAKPKDEKSASPKNAVLAKRIADLKASEADEEQLISRMEQKLNDDTEPLSPAQREIYLNSVKQSKTMLESYRQQRTELEQLAAKSPADDEETTDKNRPKPEADKPANNTKPDANAATAAKAEPKTTE